MIRLLNQVLLRPLYQGLLWLSLPAVLLRLEWRARREPEYGRRVGERFGRVPGSVPRGCIWFHAVSAGETIAVAPLVAELAAEFSPDEVPFLVTTTTPTGSAEVGRRLGGEVHHCYVPYDYRFAVRSFFENVRPRLLVLVETELWPNLIDEAHRRGVPVLLVNGRLSPRSARRYRLVRWLTADVLRQLDFIACQYREHLDRFRALASGNQQGAALGSVKFDAALPDDHQHRVALLREELGIGQRPVWVAGSTHTGEDEPVLKAHVRVCERHPDSCLLLVPRHPVRADEVCRLAQRQGFTVRRLSSAMPGQADGSGGGGAANAGRQVYQAAETTERPSCAKPTQVIVCDTMGQLQTLYGLAQAAFLGGSLVRKGGHNPIEAALCGQPLVTGPHTFNFAEIVEAFANAGCLTRVQTPAELADAIIAAFGDEDARTAAGGRALAVVEQSRGASRRLLELLRTRIGAAIA